MNPWIEVTGWTLIHFVWQGGLLAVATAVGLRLCRRRSSQARYAIACAGLTAMLASPVVTAAFLRTPGSVLVSDGNILRAVPGSEGTLPMPRISTDHVSGSTYGAAAVTRTRLDALLSFVVWGWLAGITLLLARFAGGCWRVHRLRVASLTDAGSQWQTASERIAARLRLDVAFRVVESGLVDAPGVIGWIRPVVLLPVAVLTNLAPAQIEAILAHELAHIRRRDYAVNLLQTVAETLLFYHPAVWWVSASIRTEREHCCDDVAVEVCGEATAYAAALAELATWRTRQTAMALGAADGSLLARVRRLLRVPEDDEPRSISGLLILALGMLLAAGAAVQSSSSLMPRSLAAAQAAAVALQPPAGDWRIHKTDHFEIHYQPDLDLHAERVGREAERAYEHVSSDLKHNLASRVPVILVRTTNELEQTVQGGRLGVPHGASFADPSRDRIVLAMDQPSDQWYGRITHEVTHIFGFDIIPGTATPRWITEGLAEYERGEWDPSELVLLREAVRANAIPKMSGLSGDAGGKDLRLVSGLGHAAFDFMESRWGKPGVRQFIFWLRQSANNGGDPYEGAFQVKRDEFDRAFERYLAERFAGSAVQLPAERFDHNSTLRIEGEITAIAFPVAAGFACIELWADAEAGRRRRWAVECGDGTKQDVLRALKPGDRVIVTGPPARKPAAQRMIMQSLVRPSDGFAWRAHAGLPL
jgi:beta-lactamase regulating signal transducer with metallopeptidase domain